MANLYLHLRAGRATLIGGVPSAKRMSHTARAITSQTSVCAGLQRMYTSHPCFVSLTTLFPRVKRPRPGAITEDDPVATDSKVTQYRSKLPTLPDVVRNYDGSLEQFNSFLATLLIHLNEAAWLLTTATHHYDSLSTEKQAEATQDKADFVATYGRVGVRTASRDCMAIFMEIFKKF